MSEIPHMIKIIVTNIKCYNP